jgi:hypothetical protein
LHEITDIHDVLGFQAIRRTNSQFEFIDRTQQYRIDLVLGHLACAFFLTLQVNEDRELVLQDAACATNRLFRIDRPVRLDVDDQLVEVGSLFYTGRFDVVSNAVNRAERSVQLQSADRAGLFLECRTLCRRPVASSTRNFQDHIQLTGFGQIRDDHIGIHDLDIVVELNVRAGYRSGSLLGNPQLCRITRMHAHGYLLEVQENINDILLHTFDAGVFMQYAIDLGLDDGRTRHR